MSKIGVCHGFSTVTDRRIGKLLAVLLILICLGLAVYPAQADAHAELVKSTPSAGERLKENPASAELLFSERLDSGAIRLEVLDASSRSVTDAEPERFQEGKGIRIALPRLGEGYYTVNYSVISADGHPVSGAYVFTVGNPAPLPDAVGLDPHAEVGHAHGGSSETDRAFLIYLTRIAYFAGLLITVGLAFWSLHRRAAGPVKEWRERALAFAGKYLLIAVLAYVAITMMDLTEGEPLSDWLRILTQTTVGRLYAAEILLAVAAMLLGGLGVWARLFWAGLFLVVEAWSGHAAAFSPELYTIGLDLVHLIAASLWSGGLVLLLLVWLRDRPESGRFALIFSRWALYSFLALWLTGVLSVLAFLPSPEYLLYTAWGKWLIAKIAVSLLVAVTALWIRFRLRRGNLPHGFLIKADLGLMGAIVLIVGIFTYQTPLPPNEPLHYHKMGTDMHVTIRITPNVPGENEFTLKVWLPETDGAPSDVELRMVPVGREDVGPIAVPLAPYEDPEIDAFPDFAKYTYRVEGPYLPFAGEWKAEAIVTDAKGNELGRETSFRIY